MAWNDSKLPLLTRISLLLGWLRAGLLASALFSIPRLEGDGCSENTSGGMIARCCYLVPPLARTG